MDFSELVEDIGRGVEAAGVSIMVIGIAVAVARLLVRGRRRGGQNDEVVGVVVTRREIGQSILLGLEVLVAGDIIRTVAVRPTFTTVGVLAAIVAIRTFLSMTIEMEVAGRLPWQRRTPAGERT